MALILEGDELGQIQHLSHRIPATMKHRGEKLRQKRGIYHTIAPNRTHSNTAYDVPDPIERFVVVGISVPERNDVLVVTHGDDSTTDFIADIELLTDNS